MADKSPALAIGRGHKAAASTVTGALEKLIELRTASADSDVRAIYTQMIDAAESAKAVSLPRSCTNLAREFLNNAISAHSGGDLHFIRLLLATMRCRPAARDLHRLAARIILQKFAAAQTEAAISLFDRLPEEGRAAIEPEIVSGIVKSIVSGLTLENLTTPIQVSDLISRWPEIQAFKRLPELSREAAETLPTATDAPMLKELFKRPDISGAMQNPAVDRLYARAAKGLPDDIELARLRLARLKSGNKVIEALPVARKIAKNKAARLSDLYNRMEILARLDRLSVIRRYVQRLESASTSNHGDKLKIAGRLWASGFPERALITLGRSDLYMDDPVRREIALRAFARLRRFKLMQAFIDDATSRGLKVPSGLARQAEQACRYIDAHDLHPHPRDDAALSVIADLIAGVIKNPPDKYTPIPRRVLLTTQTIGIGGAERQVTGLAIGLARQPDIESVRILAFKDSHVRYALPDIGGKLSADFLSDAMEDENQAFDDEGDIAVVSEIFGLRALFPFYRAILKFRPEVVHIRSGQHIEVALAALLAGVPRIVVHFGSMTRGQQSLGNELSDQREAVLERGLSYASNIPSVQLVANSRIAADDWARAMALAPHRVGVITNCIDQGQFKRSDQSANIGHDAPRAPVLGGVFRFAPVKDPLLWVDVAAKVAASRPDIRFIMVGDGPMRAAIERQIERAGLQSRFTLPGLVTTGLSEWLEKMDVFLMTSRTESLPNSVIEAQLMGLAVVSPDVGGISEVLATPYSGKVCSRSISDLSGAILNYFADPQLLTEIRNVAPKKILEKFSPSRQIDDARHVYGWSARDKNTTASSDANFFN